MGYSSSLTDKEWEIIEPLLPKKKRTKPLTWSKREILDGVLYQLKNGCNWCDLPCILAPLFNSILALQTVASRRDNGKHPRCSALTSTPTAEKKQSGQL